VRVLGIDPGISGAWAIINVNPNTRPVGVEVQDLPTVPRGAKGNKLSGTVLHQTLAAKVWDIAVIEHAQAMPGQGVVSLFEYGRTFGMLEGIINSFYLPLHYVKPRLWKKAAGLIGLDKDMARAKALDMFPEMIAHLRRKKDHNRAEAMLIAYYGSIGVV